MTASQCASYVQAPTKTCDTADIDVNKPKYAGAPFVMRNRLSHCIFALLYFDIHTQSNSCSRGRRKTISKTSVPCTVHRACAVPHTGSTEGHGKREASLYAIPAFLDHPPPTLAQASPQRALKMHDARGTPRDPHCESLRTRAPSPLVLDVTLCTLRRRDKKHRTTRATGNNTRRPIRRRDPACGRSPGALAPADVAGCPGSDAVVCICNARHRD